MLAFGRAFRRLYGWVFPIPGCTILRAFGRLPEQGTGETTARCHRRDINLTTNNAFDIAIPPMFYRILFESFWTKSSRMQGVTMTYKKIVDDEKKRVQK